MLPSMKSSKKGHLGCQIYVIKCLPHIQIICSGKCMRETPCIHNFLYSLKNEFVRSHTLLIHLSHDWCFSVSSSYALVLTVSLCFFWAGGVQGLAMTKAFDCFEAYIKPPPVWSRGWRALVALDKCVLKEPPNIHAFTMWSVFQADQWFKLICISAQCVTVLVCG